MGSKQTVVLGAVALFLLPSVTFARQGSIVDPVVDSAMTREEALAGLTAACPDAIRKAQTLLDVLYYSFDGNVHQGQIMVHRDCADAVKAVFRVILRERFPLTSVIPLADARFAWSDARSMAQNNTSGFNYRSISGTVKLSRHAQGRAVDMNPRLNPYCKGDVVLPEGVVYDPAQPGTLTAGDPVVAAFAARGWVWGGTWRTLKDYQHFEKE